MAVVPEDVWCKVVKLSGHLLKSKSYNEVPVSDHYSVIHHLLNQFDSQWTWTLSQTNEGFNYRQVTKYLRLLDIGHLVRSQDDLRNKVKVGRVLGLILDKLEARFGSRIYYRNETPMIKSEGLLCADMGSVKHDRRTPKMSEFEKENIGLVNSSVKSYTPKDGITPLLRRVLQPLTPGSASSQGVKRLNGTPLLPGSELLGKELDRTPPRSNVKTPGQKERVQSPLSITPEVIYQEKKPSGLPSGASPVMSVYNIMHQGVSSSENQPDNDDNSCSESTTATGKSSDTYCENEIFTMTELSCMSGSPSTLCSQSVEVENVACPTHENDSQAIQGGELSRDDTFNSEKRDSVHGVLSAIQNENCAEADTSLPAVSNVCSAENVKETEISSPENKKNVTDNPVTGDLADSSALNENAVAAIETSPLSPANSTLGETPAVVTGVSPASFTTGVFMGPSVSPSDSTPPSARCDGALADSSTTPQALTNVSVNSAVSPVMEEVVTKLDFETSGSSWRFAGSGGNIPTGQQVQTGLGGVHGDFNCPAVSHQPSVVTNVGNNDSDRNYEARLKHAEIVTVQDKQPVALEVKMRVSLEDHVEERPVKTGCDRGPETSSEQQQSLPSCSGGKSKPASKVQRFFHRIGKVFGRGKGKMKRSKGTKKHKL